MGGIYWKNFQFSYNEFKKFKKFYHSLIPASVLNNK